MTIASRGFQVVGMSSEWSPTERPRLWALSRRRACPPWGSLRHLGEGRVGLLPPNAYSVSHLPMPAILRPEAGWGQRGRLLYDLIRPGQHRGRIRSSGLAGSSSCPLPSACLKAWRLAGAYPQPSEHRAPRRATSAQLVRSLAPRAAGASPRISDHDASPPSPRAFSTCRQLLALLAYRLAEGVVLLPNPVASSRPPDVCAWQRPNHVLPAPSSAH